MVIGVCSYRPRPMTQGSRSYMLKTGAAAWGKDTWHIQAEKGRTLCGRDSSEWCLLGDTEIDHHCCDRCKAKAGTQAQRNTSATGNKRGISP